MPLTMKWKRLTPIGLSLLIAAAASAAPATLDASRAKAWQDRDTPQATAASAKAFVDLLVIDPQFWRQYTTNRPAMQEVSKLAEQKKDVEAEAAFIKYFLQKIRNEARGNSKGINRQDQEATLKAADLLMQNKLMVNGKEVDLGEPGQVKWSIVDDPAHIGATPEPQDIKGRWQQAINARFGADMRLHTCSAFNPLAQAYVLTHDQKYLDKWVAFLDDWSMNDHYFDTIDPCAIPDNVNSNGTQVMGMVAQLRQVANASLPGQEPNLSPRVIGQVLQKMYTGLVPMHIIYTRSNTHNWTPSVEMLAIAQQFDEFRDSEFYFREGRRRGIEDNSYTQNLPDGSENQQDPWYNGNYDQVAQVFTLLQGGCTVPGWNQNNDVSCAVPGWNALRNNLEWKYTLRRHLKNHVTYQIHLRTPQNEWPIPFRGGDKRGASMGEVFTNYPYKSSPEAFEDPVNMAILAAIDDPSSGVRPPYTSEWFPYGGYNIVRDGWDRNSGHGAMFCSPQPGAYGAYRSRSNNNTLGIAFNNQDLLVDDTTGHYMYPSSPIRVDGKDQFFHAGIYKVGAPAAHKVFQVSAWHEPADWRWDSSDRFNLMEGVYAGPYGSLSDAKAVAGPYGSDQSMQGTLRLDETIRGVTHQRLAMYLRGPKLWIVTDRMTSNQPHHYEQAWYIPTQPAITPEITRTTPAAFALDQIDIDPAKHTIRTFAERPSKIPVKKNMVNSAKADVSLYQFSPAQLTYSSKVEQAEKRGFFYVLYSRDRIAVRFDGTGVTQVVTAIQPRALDTGDKGDLQNIQQITSGKAGIGFTATGIDGSAIRYLSSTEKDDTLTIGNVTIHGGALMLCGDGGMALGCSAMTVGGKPVDNVPTDFEFTLSGDTAGSISPIYRPINPVTIGPEQTAFADHMDVTLTTKTPGVQIRYTTDGSEPTPNSTLYDKPFRLDHSALVRARAYRPGMTHNPYQTSGTEATPVADALFDKEALIPAMKPPHSAPGLTCSYYEGDWRNLLLNIDDLKPLATKTVPGLWDLSVIPQDNPPVGNQPAPRTKAYALVYQGYLNVPAAGTYTLQAPREFVWPDTDAGYELRVYLGNHHGLKRVDGLNEWYPSTAAHAFGKWSVALDKGMQPFKVVYIDWRTDAAKRLNVPGLKDYIWVGVTPDLRIAGPDLPMQPIPASWSATTVK